MAVVAAVMTAEDQTMAAVADVCVKRCRIQQLLNEFDLMETRGGGGGYTYRSHFPSPADQLE